MDAAEIAVVVEERVMGRITAAWKWMFATKLRKTRAGRNVDVGL
jgi:hypothetical protein